MAVVATLTNSKISVFGGWREHPPPHCHLKGPDSNCTIDLMTLDVMKGKYSKRDLQEAIEWIGKHSESLWDKWRELNERD